jgi:hypothetical protein
MSIREMWPSWILFDRFFANIFRICVTRINLMPKSIFALTVGWQLNAY